MLVNLRPFTPTPLIQSLSCTVQLQAPPLFLGTDCGASRGAETGTVSFSPVSHTRETLLNLEYALVAELAELRFPSPEEESIYSNNASSFNSTGPQRRMALWEHTCFECFLSLERSIDIHAHDHDRDHTVHADEPAAAPAAAITTASGYTEINASPAGDWNCFSFRAYRLGMSEAAFPKVVSVTTVKHDLRRATVRVVLDLTGWTQLQKEGPNSAAEVDLIEPSDIKGDNDGDDESRWLRLGVSAVIEDCSGTCHYFAIQHVADKTSPDFHHRDAHTLTIPYRGAP